MSKFFNSPVVGIDVSAYFSYAAILSPNGDVYRKSFKIKHDISGFNHLVNEIEKVEKEALSIVNIGKFQNFKLSQPNDLDIFLLKNLIREYYKLRDSCSTYKKNLSADLRVIFPNYNTVFSYSTSNTSLEILSNYPTPKSAIDAPKEDIMKILI